MAGDAGVVAVALDRVVVMGGIAEEQSGENARE